MLVAASAVMSNFTVGCLSPHDPFGLDVKVNVSLVEFKNVLGVVGFIRRPI
jgi:hypothetical protein